MENEFAKKRAVFLWQEGQRHLLSGNLSKAMDLYTQSIAVYPTAESYTFRGRIYCFKGNFEDAIKECKKAIAIDPSFGGAYNDLGSYLVAQGKTDEGITWLNRAKTAKRSDVRHTPFMNLGRLYAAKGLLLFAVHEFEQALEICPREPSCIAALQHIKRLLH